MPGNTGPKWGKGGRTVAVSRKAAGCLDGSQRRHGMAYNAAGEQHGVAGAYPRRNTQERVEEAFSYPTWRLFCTGSCSAGSTRPDAGLRTPSIAAFGRSRPSAAVDRGPRPSAATADRGIEIDVATADPCRVDVIIHRVMKGSRRVRTRHVFLLVEHDIISTCVAGTFTKVCPGRMAQLVHVPAHFVNVPDGSLKCTGT